jgi:hypothetical protein
MASSNGRRLGLKMLRKNSFCGLISSLDLNRLLKLWRFNLHKKMSIVVSAAGSEKLNFKLKCSVRQNVNI